MILMIDWLIDDDDDDDDDDDNERENYIRVKT